MFNQIKGLLQFLPPLKWWVSLQLCYDIEQWWKEEVETALLLAHADSIIYRVGKQVVKCGDLPESNPHYIVE